MKACRRYREPPPSPPGATRKTGVEGQGTRDQSLYHSFPFCRLFLLWILLRPSGLAPWSHCLPVPQPPLNTAKAFPSKWSQEMPTILRSQGKNGAWHRTTSSILPGAQEGLTHLCEPLEWDFSRAGG